MRAACTTLVAVELDHPHTQKPDGHDMHLLALLANGSFDLVFFADSANPLYAVPLHVCRRMKEGGSVQQYGT